MHYDSCVCSIEDNVAAALDCVAKSDTNRIRVVIVTLKETLSVHLVTKAAPRRYVDLVIQLPTES